MASFGAGQLGTANIIDSAVTSSKIADGAIVNDDINASAAIAGSKLQALSLGVNAGVIPSTGVANAHVSATAAIEASKLQALSVGANAGVIPSTGVADAHVSATAAISGSKLQALSVGANAGAIPSTGIVDAHVASGAAIAKSKLASLDVVDADVNASAAISGSKLQALSVGANAGVIPSTGIVDAHIASGAAIATAKLAGKFGYSLPFHWSASASPSASTTYYIGQNTAYSAGQGWDKIPVPYTGTIIAACVYFRVVSLGSAEDSTVSVYLNGTTAAVISSTVKLNSAAPTAVNTSLSQAVTAGNYLEIKWDTPAWVTPPSSVHMHATVFIQT